MAKSQQGSARCSRMRAPSRYPRRSQAEWEAVRLQAAAMFQDGKRQCEVMRALGVSRSAVSAWHQHWQEGGAQALRSKGPRGPRPKLSPQQLSQLEAELLGGPKAHGYATELWTLERIAKLIGKLFGVKYHISHVFRLLRGLGWSCQKPVSRAKERDEAAIERWVKQEWPRIKRGHSEKAP